MNLIEDTKKEVFKHLQNEFNNNESFRKELEELIIFYGRKLLVFAKTEEKQLFIENEIEDVVRSSYYQGYYTMKVILNDEETELLPETWLSSIGVSRNEIPIMLENLFKDMMQDWFLTDVSHHFTMDILTNMEPAYEITNSMIKELACYGAFKALIEDERFKGSTEFDFNTSELYLGDTYDLDFVSPQVFKQVQFKAEQHEIWDLFFWSAVQENSWVGSVHYSLIPVEDETIYVLECNLSNLITPDEKSEIVEKLIKHLSDEQRNKLQIRLYSVSELDTLLPNPKIEKSKEN